MSLFDDVFRSNAKAHEEKVMKQQMNFQREQTTMETQANDDMTYLQTQQDKSDLLKWQQDLDDELFNLIQSLRGLSKVNGDWVQVRKVQLCNDKFIHDVIIPQLKPFLNRNMINSNLEERRILRTLRGTADDIADAMSDGWDKYQITFTDWDLVMRLIKTTMLASIYRSLKGWTKKIDNTMSKRIEAFQEGGRQPEKKGFMKGLFGG